MPPPRHLGGKLFTKKEAQLSRLLIYSADRDRTSEKSAPPTARKQPLDLLTKSYQIGRQRLRTEMIQDMLGLVRFLLK